MALVNHHMLSPAKINLMLRVTGQRKDGYHNLQTLFQILDWGDDMVFSEFSGSGHNQIKITGFDDLPTENNLIYRAAQIIKRFAKNGSNWSIAVNKQIPAGGGLGGGSSNAATTLMFLNHHWQCDLSQMQLMELGSKLGADVPVFVMGKAALATGVGDVLEPMVFETPYVLLLFPEIKVSTANLFSHPSLVRNQTVLPMGCIKNRSFWINDFLPLLLRTNHAMAKLYDNIKSFARFRLSGTGSTMFALFETIDEAENVAQCIKKYVNCKLVKPKTEQLTVSVS